MSFKSYITAWSDGTTFICPYCPDKVEATEHYEKEGRTVNYTTCPTCKEIMRQKKEEFSFEDVPTTTEIMKANALKPMEKSENNIQVRARENGKTELFVLHGEKIIRLFLTKEECDEIGVALISGIYKNVNVKNELS